MGLNYPLPARNQASFPDCNSEGRVYSSN
jgi:hypothetical protein